MTRKSTLLALLAAALMLAPGIASAKVIHYELYSTDGYINLTGGVWPAPANSDQTVIAGWPAPVYIWGFTDVDPNGPNSSINAIRSAGAAAAPATPYFVVPAGAGAPQGGPVGNAKFPAPYLEATVGDDVYITLHNRGFYQGKQKVQDDHTIHLHGIHGPSQYDGFPESGGGYTEKLRYFWEEPWYLSKGAFRTGIPTPSADGTAGRDFWWNGIDAATQQSWLDNAITDGAAVYRSNLLNPAGGVTNQFNIALWPAGVGGLSAAQRELATQFTYYFRAENAGTYMYHCHVAASEHVQMGMYGALAIKPATLTDTSVYGGNNNDTYDLGQAYTWLISEFDTKWHTAIEIGTRKGFYAPLWQPQLWFLNGRTFPQNIFSFQHNISNKPGAVIPPGLDPRQTDSRYNMFVKVPPGQKYLVRMINMGYQPHMMHQHGWHMKVIGSDARAWTNQIDKFTINLGSGETYDLITTATDVTGTNGVGLNPLASTDTPYQGLPTNLATWNYNTAGPPTGAIAGLIPGAKIVSPSSTSKVRQLYPMHDHHDYQVTTNGIYPGGGLALIEPLEAANKSFGGPYSIDANLVTTGNNPGYANPYLPFTVANPGPFVQLWGGLLCPLPLQWTIVNNVPQCR